jgi:excisionase family DNA binding protein
MWRVSRKLLTSKEAADALGVAVSTLQAWAAKGIVTPAWRTPGGHARWDLAELERQLDMPAHEPPEAE